MNHAMGLIIVAVVWFIAGYMWGMKAAPAVWGVLP